MAQPSAEYEALVRAQLTELGYNSAAIPDNVLREFLADFEEKASLGDDAESAAAPLSYPTALKPAEAANARPRTAAKAAKSGASSARGRPSSAAKPAAAPVRSKPAAHKPPAKSKLATTQSLAAASTASKTLTAAPPVPSLPIADVTDGTADDDDAVGEDAPPVDEVPAFEKAHWESMRPAPSSHSRPHSARAALGQPAASPRVANSQSALFDSRPPLGSMSGVILTSSHATPRRNKSDPVSMFAKRQAQWQSDSFLNTATTGAKRAGRLVEPRRRRCPSVRSGGSTTSTSCPPPSAATTSSGKRACACARRTRTPMAWQPSRHVPSRWCRTRSSPSLRSGGTTSAGRSVLRWRMRTEASTAFGRDARDASRGRTGRRHAQLCRRGTERWKGTLTRSTATGMCSCGSLEWSVQNSVLWYQWA